MTATQEIKKELVLKASRATVWNALTTPEGWTGWFSDGVEGEFEVGETLVLDFGKHGKCYGIVVEREDMSTFAYKWHPGEDCAIDKYPQSEMTTVKFLLADHEEGTLLTLLETGFENVPESRRSNSLHLNTDGWKWEMEELQAFVERDQRQVLSRNEIVRERLYRTSREKLWDLVATPEGLKRWWVQDVIGTFAVGEMAMLVFPPDIRGKIKVVEYRRPEVFAFLSHPDDRDGTVWDQRPEEQTTETTFTLTEVEGGTHLLVRESGFDKVPADRSMRAWEDSSGGWTQVMDMIEEAIGGAP